MWELGNSSGGSTCDGGSSFPPCSNVEHETSEWNVLWQATHMGKCGDLHLVDTPNERWCENVLEIGLVDGMKRARLKEEESWIKERYQYGH
jgi:hypothetical protein